MEKVTTTPLTEVERENFRILAGEMITSWYKQTASPGVREAWKDTDTHSLARVASEIFLDSFFSYVGKEPNAVGNTAKVS